jgi:hypothetical protein
MAQNKKIAVLFLHHKKDEVTLHNYNLLKKFNPNVDIYPVGFQWHDLMEGSHVVHRHDEFPNNFYLNKILNMGTSSESDLCIYDFFLHYQDYESYFVIEWDTYCNASIEEVYGDAINKYDTFSANVFTNEYQHVSVDKFDRCVVCDKLTDILFGSPNELRKNCIEGVGQLCENCYNDVDIEKPIKVIQKRPYVKEWSWYRYFFSQINEVTEQKQLLPFLGGTYPTSLLHYKREVLYKIVELLLNNPALYNNIQNEMRLGTLLQQAGYRLESYGSTTNQFCEQLHYKFSIKNNIKGYYHPIKTIL